MAQQVVLDAMIRREDFAVDALNQLASEPIGSLSVEALGASSLITQMMRKPDFQRETNHWSPEQVVSFLESFLDNELIPSVILWRSTSYVFVIDGGHRLSALRAWIEDDYGDGTISRVFFNNEISNHQKRVADRTRKLVAERVGSYKMIRDALINAQGHSEQEKSRARNMATRQLSLQWVPGDVEKAESSFFKINTQGTPLDKTEEMLLRNRKRSVAIAARSIIRAGTGHKYWSNFNEENSKSIEHLSKKIHDLLFHPELSEPIKTLDLPMGGRASPVSALETLIKLLSLSSGTQSARKPEIEIFPEDPDGSETIKVLRSCLKVVERISGNAKSSLGLHPAIYFYTDRGRHSADMVLGVTQLIKEKLLNNDDGFFQKFSRNRQKIEKFLQSNKPLIGALLQATKSWGRADRVSGLLDKMVAQLDGGKAVNERWVIDNFGATNRSKIVTLTEEVQSQNFSNEARSAMFLKQALERALLCPVCKGYMEPAQAASYDHLLRVRDGGTGDAGNGQVTHPFCNTGVRS